jgi:hypothetical protein
MSKTFHLVHWSMRRIAIKGVFVYPSLRTDPTSPQFVEPERGRGDAEFGMAKFFELNFNATMNADLATWPRRHRDGSYDF